jgi:hypothetical protein
MTEEVVAPLDAYATAKPDEPVWTAQGGDPLAPPLLRLWALMARVRAGEPFAGSLVQWAEGVKEVAEHHSVADDEREAANLLVRATATEEISWAMDEYARGHHSVDQPTEAQDTHLSELQRIDLHELKIKVAQKLSAYHSEMSELRTALKAAGFEDIGVLTAMGVVTGDLRVLSDRIEPRRLFHKD